MAFQGTLTGNLGMKPELKTFNSGKMKTELRVAIRQQDKDAPAFWVQVDLWDKSAEYAANYLDKGDQIYAQGTIKEETVKQVTRLFYSMQGLSCLKATKIKKQLLYLHLNQQ